MKWIGLELTVKGDIPDFLGINIQCHNDGTVHLNQPHLIDSILEELGLHADSAKSKATLAASSKLLGHHDDALPHVEDSFHYRRIISKLNYLEKSTQLDIFYTTHQCACFSTDPKQPHADAVKWLGRYLKGTRDKGMVLKPTGTSFDVYIDADFAGNWKQSEAKSQDTACSQHSYIILYTSCPILWALQLQTEIALSSTESEFIGLLTALRETIPIMELVKELKGQGFNMVSTQPTVHCHVFEDNSGALKIAKVSKMCPRTKHINVKFHHFRDCVKHGKSCFMPSTPMTSQLTCPPSH